MKKRLISIFALISFANSIISSIASAVALPLTEITGLFDKSRAATATYIALCAG